MNIQIELGEHNNNGFLKELKPALYGGPFSSKLLKHFLGKRTKFSLFYNQSGFAYLGKWRPLLNYYYFNGDMIQCITNYKIQSLKRNECQKG